MLLNHISYINHIEGRQGGKGSLLEILSMKLFRYPVRISGTTRGNLVGPVQNLFPSSSRHDVNREYRVYVCVCVCVGEGVKCRSRIHRGIFESVYRKLSSGGGGAIVLADEIAAISCGSASRHPIVPITSPN